MSTVLITSLLIGSVAVAGLYLTVTYFGTHTFRTSSTIGAVLGGIVSTMAVCSSTESERFFEFQPAILAYLLVVLWSGCLMSVLSDRIGPEIKSAPFNVGGFLLLIFVLMWICAVLSLAQTLSPRKFEVPEPRGSLTSSTASQTAPKHRPNGVRIDRYSVIDASHGEGSSRPHRKHGTNRRNQSVLPNHGYQSGISADTFFYTGCARPDFDRDR